MSTPSPGEEWTTQRRQHQGEALGVDRCRCRELIAALGSGERSGRALSRAEASEALDLLLNGRCTDAQAGAFLIAHRLRRPEPQELAGLLDSYRQRGPRLAATQRRVLSFGVPFDGRSRSAPLLPLVALLLVTAGVGVVLQGGGPMPVKYGFTTAEALAALDLDRRGLPWAEVNRRFAQEGLALLHQPAHFPAAERLVPVREQIGKRPPIATLELLWSCHDGPHLQVSGFVHAPTERLAREALTATGQHELLLIKGMEGGVELPTNRVAIASHRRDGDSERLILRARDHGLGAPEVPLESVAQWQGQALDALAGSGPLAAGLIWNSGFLLWRAGISEGLQAGLTLAERLLEDGAVEQRRRQLADGLALRAGDTPPAGPRSDPAGC
ncbi:anthranilate phosphoribosyltransferase [Synechococcus sp. BA-132 BA5]|uniref:anthranilate phosphoribosyltransferase n=1 Tax=Synechococcus sp. BA-132 BA5 TaxID=3110252 RepID=UPI002B20D589|nr:anthranilate phosphoribosyltransferase [Synechococcus sp. BA-132 BA5]MEA5417346.1 anthranilate phosphoribosyltransferase [Synechococcus sp. BA-132 BA5]